MIQPGLERISQLLNNVQFPWRAIHVAGTNGKGSICHYAATLIVRRKIKCGKFTSPHLIDRWDCISIDNQPVDEALFRKTEQHYLDLSLKNGINASPFEILTATAFDIFNQEQVEIGVVEVGMGGKHDATNILNNQAISVISKIARDHQDFLGNTLEEIALHKAGILRPRVPYIINPSSERNVQGTIQAYAKSIGAGLRLDHNPPDLRKALFKKHDWLEFTRHLPLVQRENATLAAIAARQALRRLGLYFRPFDIGRMLYKSRIVPNRGRMQLVRVPPIFGDYPQHKGRNILVDGAHNPDAAKSLSGYVQTVLRDSAIPGVGFPPRGGWPVTWVLAMTEGKDAQEYLQTLLQPGDNVITTSFGPVDGMPWVKPMDPQHLLEIAYRVQPRITGLAIPEGGAFRALCAAKFMTEKGRPIVLTGSLYLVGDFHRDLRSHNSNHFWTDPEFAQERDAMKTMLNVERSRVNRSLNPGLSDEVGRTSGKGEKRNTEWNRQISDREKKRAIQGELERLEREMELLAAEMPGIGHRQVSNAKVSSESTSSTESSKDQTESVAEETPIAKDEARIVPIQPNKTIE
ncbi:uncharacterized protein SETTUDRAFT_24707 [Exserohilum turcica Et28A]|uniref:Mur ligase central domain-containing protein n=1 Tax=Exserohilum turcicum (strain 28A) TaxID=671987 RepID=R0JYA6_EXST2|nr:uncharacterized protein SETTUDRAFT_24707 [Exserohilum turcica Et28A]EOA81207.1 hypothetical protein SETTUDRAFT_24707 [Exserohilum turcica Et28A]